MKLSQEQIERLYEFTRQHYVEYYDLQTELVDHLANSIEEQWKENPKLSFETALNIEFKKFGIFGFMDVVNLKKGILNSKYKTILWKNYKDFFQLPQILITLLSILGMNLFLGKLYEDYKFHESSEWISIGLLLLFILRIINCIIQKAIARKQSKKWMFQQIISSYQSSSASLILPLCLIFQDEKLVVLLFEDFWIRMIISSLIVSNLLFDFIGFFIIPSKAKEYLKQTYPEYELVE